MYKTIDGKTLDSSVILSRSREDYMLENGWDLRHVETGETAQEAYDRIVQANPEKIVRIYSATTAVRGYHSKYAMVRWPRKKAGSN